jgi:hypothetical protein
MNANKPPKLATDGGRLNHRGARAVAFDISPDRTFDLVINGSWSADETAGAVEVKARIGIAGDRLFCTTITKDAAMRLPYRTCRVEAVVLKTAPGLNLDVAIVRSGDW